MKTASSDLLTLLASRQFYSADLYQFSLVGGGQLYYCGGDRDIAWNAQIWLAGAGLGPFFDRKDNKAKCHWKVGVEVDTLVFDVLPGSSKCATRKAVRWSFPTASWWPRCRARTRRLRHCRRARRRNRSRRRTRLRQRVRKRRRMRKGRRASKRRRPMRTNAGR